MFISKATILLIILIVAFIALMWFPSDERKRMKEAKKKTLLQDTLWHIWSMEHEAWWRAHELGYTKYKSEAGIFEYQRAADIVYGANRYTLNGEIPNEAMIPYHNNA